VGQAHVVLGGIGCKQNPVAFCLLFIELALRVEAFLLLALRLDFFRSFGALICLYRKPALIDLFVSLLRVLRRENVSALSNAFIVGPALNFLDLRRLYTG
jgi:hypothetical protein